MINGKVPARFFAYALLFIPLTILPILLAVTRPPFVSETYGVTYTHFELFGFTGSLWLLSVAWIEFRKRNGSPTEKFIILLPWLLTALFFLTFIVEYSGESLDYIGYKAAAKALLAGQNPYLPKTYIYPPLLAQMLAGAFIVVRSVLSFSGTNVNEKIIWNLVFYFYQCLQFLLIVISFWLCYRLVRIFSSARLRSVILVTALFVFNNPMIRTVRHNQINLLILDLLLLTILFSLDRPWLSGFFNSLACHLKLYPFIFILPWGIKKRWMPGIATIVFFVIVISFQAMANGIELWKEFLVLFADFPKGYYYRDNSIHSVIFNTIYFVTMPFGNPGEKLLIISKYAHALISVALVLLFANRWRKFSGHELIPVLESIPLMLLVSPLVWEHHYILLLPYALWNLSRPAHEHTVRAFIGALLIFAIPTFDLFPLSYHRIVGLLLMLSATPGWKWKNQ